MSLMETVYSVRIKYSVDNRAASGVRGLTNDVRQLGRETNRVTALATRAGAALVAAFSIRAGAKALVGFNATVQDTKLQVAGMLALSKRTDLTAQLKPADAFYARLQKRATELPGSTQEYVNMMAKVTRVITDAGGSARTLEDMTVGAVVAAKGLGEQWEVAARDIEQALMGRYSTTDPFSSKLLPYIGYKGEEGRDRWRALSAEKRLDEMKRALLLPQIQQLGLAQGQTFNGVISTLKDTVEQFFGKVGLPLFNAITVQIKSWNTWLGKNTDKVDAWATKFADGLVTGFKVVRDAIGFLVDHAGTLLAIGKVWAAVKIGGMLTRGISSGGGRLGGLYAAGFGEGGFFRRGKAASDRFDPFTGQYSYTPATAPGRGHAPVGGFKGAMGNLPLVGQAAAAGYAVGGLIFSEDWRRSVHGVVEVNGELYDVTDKATRGFVQLLRSSNALDEHLRRAAAAAPEGTSSVVTNLEGGAARYRQNVNLIMDALRAKQAFEADERNPVARAAMDAAFERATKDLKHGEAEIRAFGFTHLADRYKLMADELTGKSVALGGIGGLAYGAGFVQLTDLQRETLNVQQAQHEVLTYINRTMSSGKVIDQSHILEIMRAATADPSGKSKMSQKPNVNITIQRIEVQSDDPDRFAFVMVDAFRDAVKNPSQAIRTIREG